LDPHTAVAQNVAQQHEASGVPMVVVSTAHWGKFSESVGAAVLGNQFDRAAPLESQWRQLQNDQNKVPVALSNLLRDPSSTKKVHTVVDAQERNVLESINKYFEKT
jgi:threonine synthase